MPPMVQKGRVFFDLQGISSSVKRIPLHRNNFTFSLMDFVQNEPESDYPIQNSFIKQKFFTLRKYYRKNHNFTF